MTQPIEQHGLLAPYKGYIISVNLQGQFIGTDSEGEDVAKAWSLKELKERLDKFSKKSIRVKVLIRRYDKIQPGTLTSLKTDPYGYGSTRYLCRVSYDGGTWGEVSPDDVYLYTDENTKLAQDSLNLSKQANEISKQASQLIQKMTHINLKEYLGEQQ